MTERERENQESLLVEYLISEPPIEDAAQWYEEITREMNMDNLVESYRKKSMIRQYIGDYTASMIELKCAMAPIDRQTKLNVIMYPLTSAEEARAERARERYEDTKYHKKIRFSVLILIFLVLLNLLNSFIHK